MKKYLKALVAAAGVVLTGVNALYGPNPKVQVAIAIATLLGVYHVPNAVEPPVANPINYEH